MFKLYNLCNIALQSQELIETIQVKLSSKANGNEIN